MMLKSIIKVSCLAVVLSSVPAMAVDDPAWEREDVSVDATAEMDRMNAEPHTGKGTKKKWNNTKAEAIQVCRDKVEENANVKCRPPEDCYAVFPGSIKQVIPVCKNNAAQGARAQWSCKCSGKYYCECPVSTSQSMDEFVDEFVNQMSDEELELYSDPNYMVPEF